MKSHYNYFFDVPLSIDSRTLIAIMLEGSFRCLTPARMVGLNHFYNFALEKSSTS